MALLICLRIVGILLIALALVHLDFPRRFHWAEELSRLSPLNRQVFVVHTFFIALVVAMMGVLSALFPHLLLERSGLARVVLAGLASFWAIRLVFQWFVYDKSLWKGQRFNTLIHFVFTGLWSFFSGVYFWALWEQFQ
jgi:hypothetical protein